METYITVMFWLGLIGIVIRILSIGASEYPRKKEFSLNFDIAMFLKALLFFIWVTYLKWFM